MVPEEDEALSGRLLQLFLEEAEEQLERMAGGLEQLVAAEAESSPELVGDLFRSAHSVKGAAQAIGAGAVARTCHELEDLLARVRDREVPAGADTVSQLIRLADTVSEEVAALSRQRAGAPDQVRGDAAPSWRPDTSALPPQRSSGAGEQVPPADAGPRLRADGDRLEVLMEEASALVAAVHGAEGLLVRLSRTEQALTRELQHQGSELRALVAGLAAGDREPVEAVFRTVERRMGPLTAELKDVRMHLARQQRSLRASTNRYSTAARRARMVPFERATHGLARMVRELAVDLGKEARLTVTAADVEVDRALVLMLREVLVHLVRNAVDHGLEPPEERLRRGKPRRGSVRVEATLGSDGDRKSVV